MLKAKTCIMDSKTYYCNKDIHNIVIFNNDCGNLSSDLLTCLFGNNYLKNTVLSTPTTKCHNMITIYDSTCEVVDTKIMKEKTLYHKMINHNGHVNLYCIPNVLQIGTSLNSETNTDESINKLGNPLLNILKKANLVLYNISINSTNLEKEIDTLDCICQKLILSTSILSLSKSKEKIDPTKKLLITIDDCEYLYCDMKDSNLSLTFNHTHINDQSRKEETLSTVFNNILKSMTSQYNLEKPIKLSSMKASVYNNLDWFSTDCADINVFNLTLSQIDYLGALMCGNFNWDSNNQSEKEVKLQARLILKENEYEQYLQYKHNTGIYTLILNIQNLFEKPNSVIKNCALNYLKTMLKNLNETIKIIMETLLNNYTIFEPSKFHTYKNVYQIIYAKEIIKKKNLLFELENFLQKKPEPNNILFELQNFFRKRHEPNNIDDTYEKSSNYFVTKEYLMQCINFIFFNPENLYKIKKDISVHNKESTKHNKESTKETLFTLPDLSESIEILLDMYNTIESLTNINKLTDNSYIDKIKKIIESFVLENTCNSKEKSIDDISNCIQIISKFKNILSSMEQAEAASKIITSGTYTLLRPNKFITLLTNLCEKYSLSKFFTYHFISKLVTQIYIQIDDTLIDLKNQFALKKCNSTLIKYLYPSHHFIQSEVNFSRELVCTYYLSKSNKFWNHPHVSTCIDSNEHLCKITFLIDYIDKKKRETMNLNKVMTSTIKFTEINDLTFEKYLVNNFGFLKTN